MPTFDKKMIIVEYDEALIEGSNTHVSILGGGNTFNPRSWFWRKPNFGISHGKKAQDSTRSDRGIPSY